MKTEDFDDAIRRKLESMNNSHVQRDVDAIHHYVLSKKTGRSKHRYGPIIFPAAAVVLIGGLFTWNILQVNEINALKQTIAQLKAIPSTASVKETNELQKKDTRFIIKSMKQPSASVDPVSKNNQDLELIASDNKDRKSSPVKSGIKKEDTAESTASFYKTEPGNGSPARFEKKDVSEADLATQFSGASAVKNLSLPGKQADNTSLRSSGDDEVTADPGVHDSLATKSPREKSFDLAVDSALKPIESEKQAYLKNWHYGLGIGIEAGNYQQGYTILGEAIFKKRWVISAGIKLLRNGVETFGDDDDFDHQKKNKFKDTYGNLVSQGPNKDIGIRNTIVQIPLNVSYILPLKNNFSLLAGIGTDLDVYTKQHVEYKHINSANDFQTSQFVTNYPPVYFNNAVVTFGIQKTIRRLTFQLSPYLSPQLKRVDYKKENCYYGLRLRTFFEF
jgi:hypothetical protein